MVFAWSHGNSVAWPSFTWGKDLPRLGIAQMKMGRLKFTNRCLLSCSASDMTMSFCEGNDDSPLYFALATGSTHILADGRLLAVDNLLC